MDAHPQTPLQDTAAGPCLRVSAVIEGGPAFVGGIKPGDRVLAVNGVTIHGETHEFALAAFGLSMDGKVVLDVEDDPSPIDSPDAKKDPIRLAERTTSHDLLAEQIKEKGAEILTDVPHYDRVVTRGLSPSGPLKASKFVDIQSNPSTGFIGMSLVMFEDMRVRIGGISPKGPCASADMHPGDILVSVDGQQMHNLGLDAAATMLTANVGKWMKLGLYRDELVDYTVMLDSETERQVWLQQGEAVSIGFRLASTDKGARLADFWPEQSHAQYSALQIGDVLRRVNDNDVTGSSYDETLAAVVIANAPTLTVLRDRSKIEINGEVSNGVFAATDDVDATLKRPDTRLLMSPTGSNGSQNSMVKKGGLMKVVVLQRHETRGLGLQVCTAAGDAGARVESILPGTPAEVCGQIKIGDHILQANRLDLRHSTHEEVCLALAVDKTIELVLEEDSSPLGTTDSDGRSVTPTRTATPTKRERKSKNKSPKKSKEEEIKVVKIPVVSGMGLGLKIKTDEAKQVARISEVIKGKAAALAKNLKVGDRIISANGVYLVGRSHDEVIQAMLTKTPDGVVTLELIADKSPLHNPELRKKVIVKRKTVEGRLEGIGLKIHSAAQDYGVALGARISEVIAGGAAARTANIKVGDWLIDANGTNLERLPHDDIVGVLKSLKSAKISFTLEEDDSPMDDDEAASSAGAGAGHLVYGDRSLLSDFREILVPRNKDDNLLGFHFYSDPALPWSRVCEENLSPTCTDIGMRANDVLVDINGKEILNGGHDIVLEALQGDNPTVKMVVARPPKNETGAMYQVGGPNGGFVFPRTSVYSAVGSGIQVTQPRVHHLVVESVAPGSPAATVGVQVGDYVFGVLSSGAKTPPTIEQVRAAVANDPNAQLIFGRQRPVDTVVLQRPAEIAPVGQTMFQRVWGIDVVQVPTDPTGREDNAAAFMISKMSEDGAAFKSGLRHGDVVLTVNSVAVTTASVLRLLLEEAEVTVTVLRAADVPLPRIRLNRKATTEGFGFAVKSSVLLPNAFTTQVLPGSPASVAGVVSDLEITRINNVPIGIRTHDSVLSMIKSAGVTLDLDMAPNIGDTDIGHRFLKAVQLCRGNAGLGMKIVTKEDGKSYPRISHVETGGVAARSGVIDFGDRIISANGKSMAGITSQQAVAILVSSDVLSLELLADTSEMYQITSQYGADKAPDVSDAVKRKDWFVGDATLADAKAFTAAGQYGSFLIRRKRADGTAYTLFIQDREGKVKMYGIKWNPQTGKFVFGERYPFSNLLHLIKSLRSSGIPAVDGKRLHLFDAALSYQSWYVMDIDDNYTEFVKHIAAASPGQYLVRQRPRDKGNYLLCAKPPTGSPLLLSAKWSESREMYEVSDGMRHLFVIDSITAFVEVCILEGIVIGDAGKVQLTEPALGYSPAAPGVNTPKTLAANTPAFFPSDGGTGETATADSANAQATGPSDFASELAKLSAEVDALDAGAAAAEPPKTANDSVAAALAAARQAATEAAAASAAAQDAADMRGFALLPDLPPDDSDEDIGDEDEDLPALPEEDDEDEELPMLPEHGASAEDEDEDLPDLPPGPGDHDGGDSDEDLPPLPAQNEVNLGRQPSQWADDTEV